MSKILSETFEKTFGEVFSGRDVAPDRKEKIRLAWTAGVASLLRILVGPGPIPRTGYFRFEAALIAEIADEVHAIRVEADEKAQREQEESEREAERKSEELMERINALVERIGSKTGRSPILDLFSPTSSFLPIRPVLADTCVPDCPVCRTVEEIKREQDKPCTVVHSEPDNPRITPGSRVYLFGGVQCTEEQLSPKTNPILMAQMEAVNEIGIGFDTVVENWGGLGVAARVTRLDESRFNVQAVDLGPDDDDDNEDPDAWDDEPESTVPREEPGVWAGTRSDNPLQRPREYSSDEVSEALKMIFGGTFAEAEGMRSLFGPNPSKFFRPL